MVDPEKLRQKISFIETSLAKLEALRTISADDFKNDPYKSAGAIRLLQISIEAMIDIANHIVAQKGLGIPKTYADSFKILADNQLIEKEMLPVYIQMVRFRNRAVHLYTEVDEQEVYDIIQNHLGDFRKYIAQITGHLLDTRDQM